MPATKITLTHCDPLAFFLSNIKSLEVLKEKGEKKKTTQPWCSHSGRKDYQAYYLAAL